MIDSKENSNIKVTDFSASATFNPSNGQKNKKNQKMMKETVGSAYYIAPEVLTQEYDEKCDIWSIGVILYMMLSGQPPFEGKNEIEIVKKIKLGVFSLDIPELDHVSAEGKNLIKQMLTYNPEYRISADQALNHDWIKKFEDIEKDN